MALLQAEAVAADGPRMRPRGGPRRARGPQTVRSPARAWSSRTRVDHVGGAQVDPIKARGDAAPAGDPQTRGGVRGVRGGGAGVPVRGAAPGGRCAAHVGQARRRRRAVDRGGADRRGGFDGELHRDLPRGACAPGLADPVGATATKITMAGLAATRLFAAGGAGGVAVTAWALRRSGMEGKGGGAADDRVPGAALRGLHGGAGALRRRSLHRAVRRRAPLRNHDRPSDRGGGGDRGVPRDRVPARGSRAPLGANGIRRSLEGQPRKGSTRSSRPPACGPKAMAGRAPSRPVRAG